MPAKPTKYGIKVWMAADSSDGYVLNFDVYLGKEVDACWLIYGLGYDVVTKLIRPYMNRNHHVFFDIFFTSTKLLEHLEANDTYTCGTVRCNCKDLLSCAKDKLRVEEKLVRQKGHEVFTKWRDKQDVSVMATNLSPLADDLEVNQGDREVQKPVVINSHNSSMGDVDRTNQLRECYSLSHSSYKWYRYTSWFLIDVSICNAFVLFNYHRLNQGMGKVRELKFRTGLARQLIGDIQLVCLPHNHQSTVRSRLIYLRRGMQGNILLIKLREGKGNVFSVRGWVQKLPKVAHRKCF